MIDITHSALTAAITDSTMDKGDGPVLQVAPPRRIVVVINPRSHASAKEPDPGTFGWQLRRLRIAAGYASQRALADATGIPQNQISNYELNVSRPATPERIDALDAALGLEPGTIKAMLPRRQSHRGSRTESDVDETDYSELLEEVAGFTRSEIDALVQLVRDRRAGRRRDAGRDEAPA